MVPGFALTAVIAFAQAIFGFNAPSAHHAEEAA
jgi:hypothetical protein